MRTGIFTTPHGSPPHQHNRNNVTLEMQDTTDFVLKNLLQSSLRQNNCSKLNNRNVFKGTENDCPVKVQLWGDKWVLIILILLSQRSGTVWSSSTGIFTIVTLELLKSSNNFLAPFFRRVGVSPISHISYSELIRGIGLLVHTPSSWSPPPQGCLRSWTCSAPRSQLYVNLRSP